MYRIGKEEFELDPNTVVIDANQNLVYHVGNYKITLFSSLEDSISERNCLKLSNVKTKRIILPQPVYRGGYEYCGCAHEILENDGSRECFLGEGIYLRESIMTMKEEVVALSQMGIDFMEMSSAQSSSDTTKLLFYGTDRIQDSKLTPQEAIKRNLSLFHGYIRSLLYDGMERLGIQSKDIKKYLNMSQPITTTLENILLQDGSAGELIKKDIKQKVLR